MKNNLLQLHLGCGKRKIHGFVNVDSLKAVNPDLVEDVFDLPSFKKNSVDLIYACHVLEHSKRATAVSILKRWFDILKPGGILRVAVPDLRASMEWYLSTGKLNDVLGLIYGGQRDKYDHHNMGWDEQTLASDLKEAGFKGVKRYDWRQTDHFYVDDYSNAFLPKLSYFTRQPNTVLDGKAVSLNMEATK